MRATRTPGHDAAASRARRSTSSMLSRGSYPEWTATMVSLRPSDGPHFAVLSPLSPLPLLSPPFRMSFRKSWRERRWRSPREAMSPSSFSKEVQPPWTKARVSVKGAPYLGKKEDESEERVGRDEMRRDETRRDEKRREEKRREETRRDEKRRDEKRREEKRQEKRS